uniref:Tryptophanase n=1 Tax=candidate division WOR-3 bacterium TaxID=2052148 RepID=A0A7C4XLZ4_UNCW3
MEPYRIKVIEPIRKITKRERERALIAADYNLFLIPAREVFIDLISDSGTGAMSASAWAKIIEAEEDFCGQKSNADFKRIAREITKFPYIQPVHQGRAAERLLFSLILKAKDTVLSNTHFETTRANIEEIGATAIDLPSLKPPYCGNIDLNRLEEIIKKKRVRLIIMTLTNNIKGGQPVSLENIRETYKLSRKNNILLVFDASRFADNAFFIKKYSGNKKSIKEVCQEMFQFCDIIYLSNKKDGLVNIGGFIGIKDKNLFERLEEKIIEQESYPSSGGLASRDLAAMAVGLKEALDEDFLKSHIEKVHFLGNVLKENGVKVFEPIGGHGVVILPKENFPYASFSLGAQIYLETGVRGGVFGEEYRLALPRRVYTIEHLKFVGESIAEVYKKKLMRLQPINRPSRFFNFFARFKKE